MRVWLIGGRLFLQLHRHISYIAPPTAGSIVCSSPAHWGQSHLGVLDAGAWWSFGSQKGLWSRRLMLPKLLVWRRVYDCESGACGTAIFGAEIPVLMALRNLRLICATVLSGELSIKRFGPIRLRIGRGWAKWVLSHGRILFIVCGSIDGCIYHRPI